jgi:23S rRNA (adenine2503-C2)-methyltransferase
MTPVSLHQGGRAGGGASVDRTSAPETSGPPAFFGLSRDRLAELLTAGGYPRYRASQIFRWVYRKRVDDPRRMSNLPRALREGFRHHADLRLPGVASIHASADGLTQKLVLQLAGPARVECVSMRTERGLTYCLSSQAGCALGCAFCATGLLGLQRNLRPEEIVGQVVVLQQLNGWQDPGFNLVFMGMGEPLANYAAVVEAVRILHDPCGLDVGARRITLSTCGLVPQMDRLATEGIPLGLAVSLHATTDALRDELVPVNRRYPLADLLGAARRYGERVGRRVTLEYILLAEVNDGREDARRLARFARALPSKINLIPYNPVPGLPWKRPAPEAVERFAAWLHPEAPAVTVRKTQGGEIWAACGQLGGLSPDA